MHFEFAYPHTNFYLKDGVWVFFLLISIVRKGMDIFHLNALYPLGSARDFYFEILEQKVYTCAVNS